MENKYKTIKLDKGMYGDKTKCFSEILEELLEYKKDIEKDYKVNILF